MSKYRLGRIIGVFFSEAEGEINRQVRFFNVEALLPMDSNFIKWDRLESGDRERRGFGAKGQVEMFLVDEQRVRVFDFVPNRGLVVE